MGRKKTWMGIGITAAAVGVLLGMSRGGRFTGRGTGGDPQVGCGGPPIQAEPEKVGSLSAAATVGSGTVRFFSTSNYQGYMVDWYTNATDSFQTGGVFQVSYGMMKCSGNYYTYPPPLCVNDITGNLGDGALGSVMLESSALDDHVCACEKRVYDGVWAHGWVGTNCMTLRGGHPGMADYGIDWNYLIAAACETSSTPVNEVLEWWGSSAQGGGMSVADVNGNGYPDVVLMHVDHPSNGNNGYYRVLWDVKLQNGDYRHSSSTGPIAIGNWWGSSNQGAGAALYDIDGNGLQDLVVVHIDHPDSGNKIYYRIGWNLSKTTGQATSWSSPTAAAVWAGSASAGADVALADLDGNGRPEMIIGQVDDPSPNNYFYYNVFPNLTVAGVPSGQSVTYKMGYSLGEYTDDMGLYIADMNGDGAKDLVFSWIDDPNAPNTIYYRIGYNLQSTGTVNTWGPKKAMRTYAAGSDGAHGMVVYDWNSDAKKDLGYFWLDNGASQGTGYWDTSLSAGESVGTVVNKNSGYCMDVKDNNTASLAAVQQYTCNGTSAQSWNVTKDSDGYYTFIGENSYRCLDVPNSSTSAGALLQIYDCNDSTAQKFTLTSDGAGYYSIKNANSGLCVEVPNSVLTPKQLQQNTCTGANNQKWKIN